LPEQVEEVLFPCLPKVLYPKSIGVSASDVWGEARPPPFLGHSGSERLVYV